MNSDDFLDLFPEFSSESSERIDSILLSNACLINESAFGELYSSALAYFTAHELFLFSKNKGAPVSSEKVGDISRNYSVGGGKDAYFQQSQYGMKYLVMRDAIPKSPIVLSGTITNY